MPSPQTLYRLIYLSCLAAIGLLLVNFVGIFVPMRAAEVDGYIDFAKNPNHPAEVSLAALASLSSAAGEVSAAEFVTRATRIIHEGIAHIEPDEVVTKGFAHFSMSVPVFENWILFALRYIKPDTYRDYEFCSYRRAVERGTGRCGQQALAVVSYLSNQGFNTGFVSLGGHAIATAEVGPGAWYLLDPDYGGVIPFDIRTAERNPEKVVEHYWKPEIVRERNLVANYHPDNGLNLGGVEARYGRACTIEEMSYIAKWLIPAVLLLAGLVLWRFAGSQRRVG